VRDWAIQLLCYKNTTIRNNSFNECTAGIIIYPTDPTNSNHMIDIYGNTTTKNQPSENIIIEKNTFNRCNGKQLIYSYGRSLSNNYYIKVIGNNIFNCTNVSGVIILNATEKITVSDNFIDNVGNF